MSSVLTTPDNLFLVRDGHASHCSSIDQARTIADQSGGVSYLFDGPNVGTDDPPGAVRLEGGTWEEIPWSAVPEDIRERWRPSSDPPGNEAEWAAWANA